MVVESGVITGGALGAFGYGILRYGLGARASTLAFQGLTTGQLLHAYSCRSESTSLFHSGQRPANPYLNRAVGGSLLLQELTMLIPGLRSLLGLTPLGLLDGLVVGVPAPLRLY